MTMLALPARLARRDRKLHVDRGVVPVLVFDLGFGQRGLRAGAPEHRLLALINEALFDEDGEGADDLRLVGGIERQIRVLPIAQDAEPLELLALDVDELARERLRLLAHFAAAKARAIPSRP